VGATREIFLGTEFSTDILSMSKDEDPAAEPPHIHVRMN
jgi:hypothetical protein